MEQIVSRELVNEESKILRECRGRRLALLGRVFGRCFDDTPFYVESETNSDKFYYVKFVFESSGSNKPYFWCTCPDFPSTREEMCKHCWACFYAKRLNLVQTVDKKLPLSQFSKDNIKVKSWTEDDYSF